jgi:hypothetical protein
MKEFFSLSRFLFENEAQSKETEQFLKAAGRFDSEFKEDAESNDLYDFFLENFGGEDEE